jgi:hypothetical protein
MDLCKMQRQLFILKISIALIVLVVLASCTNSHEQAGNSFGQFLSRLPVLHSFYYDLNKQDAENCYAPTGKDTLFFNPPLPIIGLLPDTIDNYKIVYLYPGDDHYPYLKTFSKNGQLIDDQNICYGDCAGWDCTTDSCESYVKLLSNHAIEAYIKVTSTDCDSIGKKIPSTTKTEVRKQTISVNKKGKIIFNDSSEGYANTSNSAYNFSLAIALGDSCFFHKNYTQAKIHYQNASKIFPEDVRSAVQIHKCDEMINNKIN